MNDIEIEIELIFQELVKTGIVRVDEVKRIGQEENVGRGQVWRQLTLLVKW